MMLRYFPDMLIVIGGYESKVDSAKYAEVFE